VSDRPSPGEYDEAELLSAVRRILAEGRAGVPTEKRPGQAVYAAYVRANRDDPRYGNLAGLFLFWILGGDGGADRLDIADEILNGSGDDPRRTKVYDVAHRLSTGEITWTEFLKVQKKGLIPRRRQVVPTPSPDAVPLAEVKERLQTMLTEAAENDMCLFQWGVHDWGQGQHFEVDFTRQFVLHEGGDYDHMEQLSLTLLIDSHDPDLLELGSGDLWSGDNLAGWVKEVESLPVFSISADKLPSAVRLDHSNV